VDGRERDPATPRDSGYRDPGGRAVNLFADGLAWLVDPAHWNGSSGIPTRLGEHLAYSLVALVVSAVIAVPLGYLIGHTLKGRNVAVLVSGALRALPSLGLFVLMVLIIGAVTGTITGAYLSLQIILVLLAVPSILAGAYSGIEAIDRRTVDAARSIGMTEWQILAKVEIPLGLPLLIGGVRAAMLQVIATATIGSYAYNGGLGTYIFQGLAIQDYAEILGAAILVTLLALVFEVVFVLIQRATVPKGITAPRADRPRSRPAGQRSATGSPAA
jgi:osmoprotectant transport system permease protein